MYEFMILYLNYTYDVTYQAYALSFIPEPKLWSDISEPKLWGAAQLCAVLRQLFCCLCAPFNGYAECC